MSDTPLETSQSSNGRRLNGWKEIAAHLGRGVRTAQRWEHEYGMPVRRMGPNRAESVFAFVEEIDAWLTSASAATARGERSADAADPDTNGADQVPLDAANGGPPTAPADPKGPPASTRIKVLVWILGSLTVLLAAIGYWRESSPRTTPLLASCVPAAWVVAVDTITVRDTDERTCWSHAFPAPLRVSEYELPSARLAGIEDVDDDGERETWVVMFPDRSEDARHSAFFLFDARGRVRWEHRFKGSARFGEVTYAGPWAAHRLFVTERPEGGSGRAIWAVSRDAVEFPAVLQRLDPASGQPQSAYWSNGYLEALTLTQWKGRSVLLAGGAFNDRVSPAVAVIDAANPNGSAPASNEKYRCTTCPAGAPLALVVFPKPVRFNDYSASGSVLRIDPGVAPIFVSVTAFHASFGGLDVVGIYRLDEDLMPLRADVGDGYLAAHERMVRAGILRPFADRGPASERELLPLLHWRDGRFVAVGRR